MLRGVDVWGMALQNALGQLGQAYGQRIQSDRRKEEIGNLLSSLQGQQDLVASDSPLDPNAMKVPGLPMGAVAQPRPMFDPRNQAQLAEYARLDPTGFQVAQSLQPKTQFINQERGGLQAVRTSPNGKYQVEQVIAPTPEGPKPFNPQSTDWQIEYDKNNKPVTEKVGDSIVVRQFKWQQNPITQQWEKIYSHGKSDQPPSPWTGSRPAMNLSKDYRSTAEVKYFNEIVPRFSTMEKAFTKANEKNPQTFVAVDQALITLFNKMTDPASVVRESEYARTPEDMALVERVKAFGNRMLKGGRLEPKTRAALMDMARKFYDVAAERYGIVRSDYEYNAKVYGMDPKTVLGTDMRGIVKLPGTQQEPAGDLWTKDPSTMTIEELRAFTKEP